MVWWLSLAGFALGCVVAYLMAPMRPGEDDEEK